MDPNRAGPPREPTEAASMMQQMMDRVEKMCGTGEFSPASMCQRWMASMGAYTREQATTGPVSPREGSAREVEDCARHGCCGPGADSRDAPKPSSANP